MTVMISSKSAGDTCSIGPQHTLKPVSHASQPLGDPLLLAVGVAVARPLLLVLYASRFLNHRGFRAVVCCRLPGLLDRNKELLEPQAVPFHVRCCPCINVVVLAEVLQPERPSAAAAAALGVSHTPMLVLRCNAEWVLPKVKLWSPMLSCAAEYLTDAGYCCTTEIAAASTSLFYQLAKLIQARPCS